MFHRPFARGLLLGLVTLATLRVGAAGVRWTNGILTYVDGRLPGGSLEILYLEAFCRPGGHERDWAQTRMPHQTQLLSAAPDASELSFRTTVGAGIEIRHGVRVVTNGLVMSFDLVNHGPARWDGQWFQPACVRVDRFTGRRQADFPERSFVFTSRGRTPLSALNRTTDARYPGGQVYLPPWIESGDANPRPIARDRLTNGIIGCVSGDDRWLLALASDRTFELFEGVYVCLHSDPWIGGLAPGETRSIRQRLYFGPNDPVALLRQYVADFAPRDGRW